MKIKIHSKVLVVCTLGNLSHSGAATRGVLAKFLRTAYLKNLRNTTIILVINILIFTRKPVLVSRLSKRDGEIGVFL